MGVSGPFYFFHLVFFLKKNAVFYRFLKVLSSVITMLFSPITTVNSILTIEKQKRIKREYIEGYNVIPNSFILVQVFYSLQLVSGYCLGLYVS